MHTPATTRAARPRRVIRLDPDAARRNPPRRRRGYSATFELGPVTGQLITNAYPDGALGEFWVRFDGDVGALAGYMDSLSSAVSIGLQHGVPLDAYVSRYAGTVFEPSGPVDDPEIEWAGSVPDYVFRRLALDFLDRAALSYLGLAAGQ